MLVMMVVLVISWAMMLNIAKLLSDRMILQNAADNAALSAATAKARLLNKLGQLNYLMGCALYGTAEGMTNYNSYGVTGGIYGVCLQGAGPADFQRYKDTQERIGSIFDASHNPYCTGIDKGWNESAKLITAARNLVFGMAKAQDALRYQFLSEFAVPIPSFNRIFTIAQNQEFGKDGVDDIYVINPQSVLLEDVIRNRNGVGYCKTESFCVSVPPNPITPPGAHVHVYWAKDYIREKESWLYVDKEKFHKNLRITVLAVKKSASASGKGYPLLGKWIGIEWPEMNAVASAAVFNRRGPMFPVEERGRPSDRISPVIQSYKDAEKGGWDAQLVPAKKMGIQH